jgi:hypothetical protein
MTDIKTILSPFASAGIALPKGVNGDCTVTVDFEARDLLAALAAHSALSAGPLFEIVDTGDDEVEEIRLNGEYLVSTNHDEHGWAGMEAARNLVTAIAKRLGGKVETIYEGASEDGADD